MSPFFFKPECVEALLAVLQEIGQAAPQTPLYYYDIPSMTGVHLPMVELLEQGREQIPTLRGLKYTNSDFLQMQRCMQVEDGYFDVLFGHDAVLAASQANAFQHCVMTLLWRVLPVLRLATKAGVAISWCQVCHTRTEAPALPVMLFKGV